MDFTTEEIQYIFGLSKDFKNLKRTNTRTNICRGKRHRTVVRKDLNPHTRCSFPEVAGNKLGYGRYLSRSGFVSDGVKKESLEDTAKVLGRMYDGIEYRGFDRQIVEDLAKHAGVPVWNGLTTDNHPTQMLADVLTIRGRTSVTTLSNT